MTDFVTFGRLYGLEIDPGRLHPSDKIRRCGTTDKPRSLNGAFFWDGERGWVWNWASEARVQWWNDPAAKEWTEAEKAQWRARRVQQDACKERGHQAAAQRAQEMIAAAALAPHNYFSYKGFPDEKGFVAADGSLLIPMRSAFGSTLQGVQIIRWLPDSAKYEKKMLPGMKAKAAVYRMGDKRAPEMVLCEGYATGLSIMAAIRSAGLRIGVLVCFSAGNLVHVAASLKCRAVVFADNDASGAGERAAKETGLRYCMADEVGLDANDLHVKHGVMEVCKKLIEARTRAMAM